MAEKRMICKSISVSEDVNFLPDIFDMLLFTWMIPHADDFGRLPGSPAKIKAIVVPMLDKSVKEIEDSLQKLQGSKLISWYEVSGEKYIQLITFEKHQSGLHKRTKSKYPEEIEVSRKFPEIPLEGKGTEQKGIGREEEGKGREMPSPDSNPHKDSILKMVNACEISDVTLYELDIIYSYIGVCDIEVIESCIKKGQKKHINYAIKTLKGRVKDGIIRKEQLNPIEVGEYDAKKFEGQLQSGGTDSKNKSITGDAVGWLPSSAKPANYAQLLEVSGQ